MRERNVSEEDGVENVNLLIQYFRLICISFFFFSIGANHEVGYKAIRIRGVVPPVADLERGGFGGEHGPARCPGPGNPGDVSRGEQGHGDGPAVLGT